MMTRSMKERMLAGELYLADDPELERDAHRAQRLTHQINTMDPTDAGRRRELLAELLAIPPLVYTPTPRRASDQDCFIADITKAQRLLGWSPAISCREGVASMLTWTETQLMG